MPIFLKQSTASQEILLPQFVDSTDGVTAETGLTIANTDIKIWVAGATTLANKNSGGATHISNGYYYAVLDATDTATLGSMVVNVAVSGALPVRLECVVLAANVYDSLVADTATLAVDVARVGNDADAASGLSSAGVYYNNNSYFDANVTAMANGSITAAVIATGAIDADALATDAVTEIVTAIFAELVETGVTFKQVQRAVGAALAGKVENAGTASELFRAIGNDATTRITTTGDVSGNRDPVLNL